MNHKLDKEGYYRKYAKRESTYQYTDHIKRKTNPKTFKKEDKEIEKVMKKTGFLLGEALSSKAYMVNSKSFSHRASISFTMKY